MRDRVIMSLIASLFIGCGGAPRPGEQPHEHRLRQGGEGPEVPDGKGTWVVNPVTPDQISWTVMRGTAVATAPVQAGDTIDVKCTNCQSDQKWLTAWTLKAGVIQRTIHVDKLVNPLNTETLGLQAGDEELRVIWARQKLHAAPDDFENLSTFSDPRASPISFSQSGAFVGELHWGPLPMVVARRRGGVVPDVLAAR